ARPALLGPGRRTFTRDRLLGLRGSYPDAPLLGTSGQPQEVMALTEAALRAGHDALIVTDDALLPALLKALKRAGRRAPDVGVVGMGNDVSGYLDPEVTSIDFGAARLGEVAASHLLDHLGNVDAPPLLTVPHRLVARESTRR
ncbi:substrate-binding domain-containing protein, partial [Deinococcus metallilatus]